MTIKTITPDEVRKRLRAAGVSISTTTIRDGLKQRVFPFGYAIETEKSVRFLISEKTFEKWMQDWADEEAG